MKNETQECIIQAKVLGYWLIQKFSGEAILAAVQPRFVVAVMIGETKGALDVANSGVTIVTHKLAFFAISSITKVFAESDVIGKAYNLQVQQQEVNGQKTYSLAVVG